MCIALRHSGLKDNFLGCLLFSILGSGMCDITQSYVWECPYQRWNCQIIIQEKREF